MKLEKIDFFSSYSFLVSFTICGVECFGTLSIEPSKLPTLKIEKSDLNIIYRDCLDINDELVCEEFNGINSFILHNCEYSHGMVYPKAITNGKVFHQSNKLEVYLTGISTWFERNRRYEFKGELLTRDTSIENFKESFKINELEYTIENTKDVDIVTSSATCQIVSIYHSLYITKATGFFTIDEASLISKKLKDLFSILIGSSLSVTHLYLISGESNYKYNSLYFTQHNYDQNPIKFHHEAFCFFPRIIEWSLWATILSNYFSKDSFDTIWCRLAPIYSQDNFWEYNILSHVITLEMYCAKISAGKGTKLDKKLFKQFKFELIKATDKFISETALNSSETILLEGMRKSIDGFRNTSHPTLKEKYYYLLSQLSHPMKDAISFSDDDFLFIKKFRDSVAHGLGYQTNTPGNITKEMGVTSRLLIFLMYLAYRELGFSDEQFALCVYYSHSPMLRDAHIDEREIDAIAKTAEFIEIDTPISIKYETFKPIVIELGNCVYHIDEYLTDSVQNNQPDNEYFNAIDHVKSLLPEDAQANFLGKVYIKNKEIERVFYSVILIVRSSQE
ncbi:hypothetical protein [Yokenella regensburgei]|jgi:hypothetical protein|uniref:hypothetical protein n=1 Tax=Yokenella regensburgei TaxID=158877 RepID=UPI000241FE16|nr:hypothetical protein [Yokenella regensburgei]EHM49919.1 hypothetical protein HMPREF0880_01436 [Yokenella regensburgei ATCC 43003]